MRGRRKLKKITVSYTVGVAGLKQVFEDKEDVKYEPEVDPLGNLNIICEDDTAGPSGLRLSRRDTVLYLGAHTGWVIEFERDGV
jgi:hypothetical protein